MIVKNESSIILEALESTLPVIDTYCIVDTGSTDDTIDKIKKFYDGKISGVVHERPWVDFGTNRSEALKLCDGLMDYILVIDADDIFHGPVDAKASLHSLLRDGPNYCMLQIKTGCVEFYRPQIFKANDDWRYVGVLHEYATNDKEGKSIELPSVFYNEFRTKGSRSASADKYLKDVYVLLNALSDEPDNERYVFYLAQSYKDSGNVEKAIEFYTKRYHMGRWSQEVYVSALNLCRLTKSKEWAWKAHEVCPERIECLLSYMAHCRENNMWSQELYAMASYAITKPKPRGQYLFLESDAYDWKAHDEFSIIASYTGHNDKALEAAQYLLKNPAVPSCQIGRIRTNATFFK